MKKYIYYIILHDDCGDGSFIINYFNVNWSGWYENINDGTPFEVSNIDEFEEFKLIFNKIRLDTPDSNHIYFRKYTVETHFVEEFVNIKQVKESFNKTILDNQFPIDIKELHQ